jgi:hypothetical protein
MTTNISESSNYFLNSQLDPVMNLSLSEYQALMNKYPRPPMAIIDPKEVEELRKAGMLSGKPREISLTQRTIRWIDNHSGSIATATALTIAVCAYATFYR